MHVFVAGGTGVIGRRLVPQLVANGHRLTATTTSSRKLGRLTQLGAEGIVMNAISHVEESVTKAKCKLGWVPRYPSWPIGFKGELA